MGTWCRRYHDVSTGRDILRTEHGPDCPPPGCVELLPVVANQGDVLHQRGDNPGAEDAQAAVAHHHHVFPATEGDLLQYLAGSGQGFQEYSAVVGYVGWQFKKVCCGQDAVISHAAVQALYAQDAPVGAVAPKAGPAPLAAPAGGIDFPCYSLAGPTAVVALVHCPDELMAQHAAECHVSPHYLHVGLADAGCPDLHQGPTWRGLGHRVVGHQPQSAVEDDSAHCL